MSRPGEDNDKPHEPTQRKLEEARRKGEVARSTDVSTAASYAGLLLAALAAGGTLIGLGDVLSVLIDRAHALAPLVFEGAPSAPMGGLLRAVAMTLLPWFLLPAVAALVAVIAQRAFVVTPSKLALKASRIDPVQNAKNKYGRNGLFEFAKSFAKLLTYSVALGIFLKMRLSEMVGAIHAEPRIATALLARLTVDFLFVVLLIAVVIGAIDYAWQRHEHLRKNRMSRKELQDETKESEGDPHLKQARRSRAERIATSRMMAEVPRADVVIVNPTHVSVALKWSRRPGDAPECVAKGVDEIALRIREIARAHDVPIHADAPTARALNASVEIGAQVAPDQYRAVAAAIRFAEDMRRRAKGWRRDG